MGEQGLIKAGLTPPRTTWEVQAILSLRGQCPDGTDEGDAWEPANGAGAGRLSRKAR